MPNFHSDEIYKLELYNRNSGGSHAYCDLLVTDRENTIYAANIIGTDTKAKLLAFLMQEGKTGRIERAEGNVYESGHIRPTIYALSAKKAMYDEEILKIDDLTQIFMTSKSAKVDLKARNDWMAEEKKRLEEGLGPRDLPHELSELVLAWNGDYRRQVYEVLDDRYNTPMLEEWSEYIIDALISEGYYEPLQVKTFGSDYQLAAGLLRITEEQLEEIISIGIQGYELDFAIEEDGRDPSEAVLPHCTSIDSYLTHFAGELGARIQENVRLRFSPETDHHHPAFHDVNLQANENGITGLYPPQANTVMGVSRTLVEEDYCFIIGEMGTGKTTMGEIVPYLTEAMIQNVDTKPKPQRVIVMAPSIMVEKWAREIKERIPNCDTYQINHWTDVKEIADRTRFVDSKGKEKFKKPEKWEYYIMSSETPKFTYPTEPIKDWRTHKGDITFYSPTEVEDGDIRYVTRMLQDGEGKYYPTSVAVVNPENKIRFYKEELYNMASGRTNVIYQKGATSHYCPKCGQALTSRNGERHAGENFFGAFNKTTGGWSKKQTQENLICTNDVSTETLPKEDIKEWVLDPNSGRYVPRYEEQKCGYVLWQPSQEITIDTTKQDWEDNVSGYRKVSPAWFINKHLPRGFFKYLIADEVHEYKSGDSSTGKAFGQLVNHTEKQVLLTGTLFGGMSRDIFYLLARLNPKRLLKESITYKDAAAFNKRYGIVEYTSRAEEGKMKKSSAQKPGISPHLFPMHMMGNCAFLELNDMGYALPPYQEIPVVVNMSTAHASAYRQTGTDIKASIAAVKDGLKGMGGISTYINAMYQFADAPFNVGEIAAFDEEGQRHVLASPEGFDMDEFTPEKVQQLINIMDQEIYEHGRKNLVYVKYTGKEAWNQMDIYLYEKLKSLGYKVGILRNGSSYDGIKMPKNSRQREDWLHKMMAKHDWDILITNPRLVKVGLDLLAFPNIHFFQMDYSTYDYMQASRRSWRLKQTKDVKVYTYIYKDTIQEQALQHIARKIDAAMAMQGKFSEEGLRAMADSSDGMNALAKQLLNDDNVLEGIDTVHDMFARKNQSFEEMQSVEFQDYDGYVMNPIEGGIETVRKIAEGVIKHINEEVKQGRATEQQARRATETVTDYMEMFEQVLKTVEDIREANKGISKKKQIVEGQQELDLFALV